LKTVFRLCSKRYPANDGKGAALKGGRWNPAGTEVIYTSVTASLAALEVLANYSVLPRDFMLTEIQIPDTVAIEYVTGDLLPAGWNSSKPNF
jgi:RES domain-containing protein